MVLLNAPEEELNNWNGVDGCIPEIVYHADVMDSPVKEDACGREVDIAELTVSDAVTNDAFNNYLSTPSPDDRGMGGIICFGRGHVFHDRTMTFALPVERVDDAECHFHEPVG